MIHGAHDRRLGVRKYPQWTVTRDDENHAKLVCGGPLSFPDLAILDPVTLESLPTRVAAATGVDALTHALEAYTSGLASPITDALALDAVRLLSDSLRRSVCATYDIEARSANMIVSSMANIACGNAETEPCTHAVSAPGRPGGSSASAGRRRADVARAGFQSVVLPESAQTCRCTWRARCGLVVGRRGDRRLRLGSPFPLRRYRLSSVMDGEPVAAHKNQGDGGARRPRTVRGSEQAAKMQGKINDDTIIACSAPRKMSVREAEAIYAACLA